MRRLDFCMKHFGLQQARVLDVGCGRGHYLQQFGPGSVGIDIRPELAIDGVVVRAWTAGDGIPADLVGEFDAVWCSNFLEHVPSPHELLIELRPALKPGGRLFVLTPRTNLASRGPWRGYAAAGHINFFTPATLRWTVRRAGYEVEWVGSPSVPWAPLWFARGLGSIGPGLAAVASRIENWQYPSKSIKRLVDGKMTYLPSRDDS